MQRKQSYGNQREKTRPAVDDLTIAAQYLERRVESGNARTEINTAVWARMLRAAVDARAMASAA